MTNGWMDVRVADKRLIARDIVSLELVAADAGWLPDFSAGSHIDVSLPNGMVRQYSLCNDASERHRYRIAVLRDPRTRGGSQAVHDEIAVGDLIQISSPRNHFSLVQSPHALLLAGGIGITPLLCMAQRLSNSGCSFEMHYCAKSKEQMAFWDEIQGSSFADRVHFHFSEGFNANRMDANLVLAGQPADSHLYICGSNRFIDAVTASAKQNGWADSRVHFEHFAGEAIDSSMDAAFKVKVASSGLLVDVPAGKTLMTALAEQGVSIPVSCEQGVCGSCVTRVLEGIPEHRDLYFTDEEKSRNDQMTPCCSRSKTPLLVLDI